MANLTADGDSIWYRVYSHTGVSFSVAGDFGGGTLAIYHRVGSGAETTLKNNGVAVTYTAGDNVLINVRPDDLLRVGLSGSTEPDLNFFFSGAHPV